MKPTCTIYVLYFLTLLVGCNNKDIVDSSPVNSSGINDATSKHPISDEDFYICMGSADNITTAAERPTKKLDSVYAQRIKNATSETQVRSILSERFTLSDVTLLVNSAYTAKNLTTNISNTRYDWNNKVDLYMRGGGSTVNLYDDECDKNRENGLQECDKTEWFMIGCSILGGFINPWLGIGVAIETKIAADGCRSSVESSFKKCRGKQ